MTELDDIKARAAERRKIIVGPDSDVSVVMTRLVEPERADLTRALAIAEEAWDRELKLVKEWTRAGLERDQARAELKKMGDHEKLYVETELKYQEARAEIEQLKKLNITFEKLWAEEAGKARAAAVSLRKHLASIWDSETLHELPDESYDKVLAETAWLEQHR